jgi:hypothetical protein
MTKKIVNCTTGEEIEIELSADDLAQQEIDAAIFEAKEIEKAAQLAAKEAVLAKLGLTTEEAAALLA